MVNTFPFKCERIDHYESGTNMYSFCCKVAEDDNDDGGGFEMTITMVTIANVLRYATYTARTYTLFTLNKFEI